MLYYTLTGFDTDMRPLNPRLLDEILQSNYQHQLIDRIRKCGDREARSRLKTKLRALVPMGYPDEQRYAEYERQYEAQLQQVPAAERAAWMQQNKMLSRRKAEFFRATGLYMVDVDHIEGDVRACFARVLSALDARGLTGGKVLAWAYVTASGDGLRLICRRRPNRTIVEDQQWLASMAQLQIDEACKDVTRLSYLTTEEDTLYRDDEVLFASPAQLKQMGLEVDSAAETQVPQTYPTTYHGHPIAQIIDTYWLLNNHGHQPQKGDRDALTYRLACDLRHICGNNAEWLDQVIPCYDGFTPEAKRQKIRNALNSNYQAMSSRITRVLAYLDQQTQRYPTAPADDEPVELPPAMPQRLPKLVELLLSCTPDVYKPTVAHAIFPSLAAHLYKVTFNYIDNKAHEATLMCVLMAQSGAGKDCITTPINYIMADIRQRDAENMRRERVWKNECTARGANKDKAQRPEGLIIQEIDADITNPAFVMRTKEAQDRFLYTKINEIELFNAFRGQQYQLMCLAFDPENQYGQTRVGVQSVTEKVKVRFNFNASTTLKKGREYFAKVLTDGPISRLNICTIPPRPIGSDMPVYGTYPADFADQLQPFIDHLCQACGPVHCQEAIDLAWRLKDQCADQARLSQDEVYENLSYRALVIAYLKACVLYVANGCVWEPEIADFVQWSLEYDLWCKMSFFGDDIRTAECRTARQHRPGRPNMLVLLPNEFTLDQAGKLRTQMGLTEQGTRNMLSQWGTRGYIKALGMDRFQKLKFIN